MARTDLSSFDYIIINSSAGKDSLVALWEIYQMVELQGFPKSKVLVSHQDLGRFEWPGTRELAERQAGLLGFRFVVSARRDKNGRPETFLEYVRRRRMWPSSTQRWCTSDFKRGPGRRIITSETPTGKILHVFGFRAEESPARKAKEAYTVSTELSNRKRTVVDYLPVHEWSTAKVWEVIKKEGLPYHYAYDLGIPRLSCIFCFYSPFDVLVKAGQHNIDLLREYVEVEKEIGHRFTVKFALEDVLSAVESGYEPKNLKDWKM